MGGSEEGRRALFKYLKAATENRDPRESLCRTAMTM